MPGKMSLMFAATGAAALLQDLGEQVPIVGRGGEVAVEQLARAETGPRAVHLAALDPSAQQHHCLPVAVVGPVRSVLACGAAELGERDQRHPVHEGAEVGGERRQRVGQLREMAVHPSAGSLVESALALMHVPVAVVDRRDLQAHPASDQASDITQGVGESAVGIDRTVAGHVSAGAAQRRRGRQRVQGGEGGRGDDARCSLMHGPESRIPPSRLGAVVGAVQVE